MDDNNVLYIMRGPKDEIFKRSKAIPPDSGIRLNLGCGHKHIRGYINVDIQEPCDLKHDLRTTLPFTDNSVDEVFSEGNVVSLFSANDWRNIRKELVRVLKPGGKLGVIFLDVEYIVRNFLSDKGEERWSWLEAIHGYQGDEREYVKNGFTTAKLAYELKEEGIENVSWKSFTEHKWIHPRKWVHLTGFKKKLLLMLVALMLTPRLFLSSVAYTLAERSDDDAEIPNIISTSTPKKKRKFNVVKKYSLETQNGENLILKQATFGLHNNLSYVFS